MQIKNIDNKQIWENFLESQPQKTFLHSWNWGEFNQIMGNKVWRLGIYRNKTLVCAAQIIKTKAKRGTFLLCPHGPYLNWQDEQQFKILVDYLKTIAHQEKCSFIRIAPFIERNETNRKFFQKCGFIYSPIHTHAEYTWNLNLKSNEEKLLKNMRKTTRYCIRKAEKEGVKIIQSNNPDDLKYFLKLQKETMLRHRFTPFSHEFLKNELLAFTKDNQVSLFLAEYQKEILASAIIIFWQKISFYHHGASSTKFPKIPASYLLQWEVITEAKKRGCQLHNLWGIAEEDKTNHPWTGITLFKTGFGGFGQKLLQSQDLPLKPGYWLTYVFERIRKKWRGFS